MILNLTLSNKADKTNSAAIFILFLNIRQKKKMCVSGFSSEKLGMVDRHNILLYQIILFRKYSSVFRENRCPPPPKTGYGGNFSHENVTLKIRSY